VQDERPPHRAVLFDLFDTLCSIDESVYLAGKAEEARLLDVDQEPFVRAWIAAGDDAQKGVLPDLPARVRQTAATLGRRPDDDIVRRIEQVEIEALSAGTALYPDTLPTLAAVRRHPGLKVGLVSNASSAAESLFDRLGLPPFFDRAIFSFRVGAVKPDPRIYLAACAQLEVPPDACLFVGDGNGRELDGAKSLGMDAVRIERPPTLNPYRKEPSRVFDASVDDLRRIVSLIRT
jgi:putative hydrolase of the HAD superfamily